RAEAAFEGVHGRTADAIEAGERRVMAAAERGRRRVAPAASAFERQVREHPFVAVAAALFLGYTAGRIVS
ncbi:MAG: hypothetical protein ACODAE_04555, partial [Gemmatimonadota bacterium]